MAQRVSGIVSGLFVLALGVATVAALLRPEQAPMEATQVSSVSIPGSTFDRPPASITPELPGVSSRVSRVLDWNGDAAFATADELAQLPPAVAAVLTRYGVPLRVPTTGEGG